MTTICPCWQRGSPSGSRATARRCCKKWRVYNSQGVFLLSVNFVNQTQAKIDKRLLDRVAKALEQDYFQNGATLIEVSFVSSQKIKSLNRTYRTKNVVTDVLSFAAEPMPVPKGQPTSLGEVIVCVARAKQQAEEYGHGLDRELAFLIVHGVLHLLNYDHLNRQDELKMRLASNEIMAALKLQR